eukprot:Clim_evm38s33 gene=Clim_evmTU38s33
MQLRWILVTSLLAIVSGEIPPQEDRVTEASPPVIVRNGYLNSAISISDSVQDTIQPKKLETSFLKTEISYRMYDGPEPEQETQEYIIEYWTPIAIATAVGFALAILTAVGGCCVCMCRCCCNKCGGKMYQKSESRKRKIIFTLLFLITTAFIAVGAILTFLANENISTMPDTAAEQSNFSLDAIEAFVNNFLTDVEVEIVDEIPEIADELIDILLNVGETLAEPIADEIEGAAEDVFDAIEAMDVVAQSLSTLLDSVITTRSTIVTQLNDLNTDLGTLNNDLQTLRDDCAGTSVGLDCNEIPQNNVTQGPDPADIPNLDDERSTLNDVLDVDLAGKAAEGRQILADMAELIMNETESTREEIQTMISDNDSQIADQWVDIRDSVLEALYETFDVNKWRGEIDKYMGEESDWKKYDAYRRYAGIAMAGLGLLVATLGLLGVAMGYASHSNEVLPCDRSFASNTSGRLIKGSAIVAWLIGFWVFIVVALHFFLGTSWRTICEPVETKRLFYEVLDDPDVTGGKYMLSDALLDMPDSDIITFQNVFTGCQNNQAIWTVLSLGEKYNLTEYADLRTQLDLDSELEALVSFADLDLITESTRAQITSLGENVVPEETINTILAELDESPIDQDISSYETELQTFRADVVLARDALPAGPQRDTLTNMIATIDSMITTIDSIDDTLSAFSTTSDSLSTAVNALADEASTIPNQTIALMDTIEDFIDEGENITSTQLTNFVDDVFTIVDNFASRALTFIEDEAAQCLPISQAYEAIAVAACTNTHEAIDGFWFALGLIAIALPFHCIFGLILMKYFKRMDEKYYNFDLEDDYQVPRANMPPVHINQRSSVGKHAFFDVPKYA